MDFYDWVNGRPWRQAIADFNASDPTTLADLLRTKPIPKCVRNEVADAIAAAPIKRARNADKRKGTSAQRRLANELLAQFHRTMGNINVGAIADELGMEPSEVVARRAEAKRQLVEYLAKQMDLAPDSIRKMQRGK